MMSRGVSLKSVFKAVHTSFAHDCDVDMERCGDESTVNTESEVMLRHLESFQRDYSSTLSEF